MSKNDGQRTAPPVPPASPLERPSVRGTGAKPSGPAPDRTTLGRARAALKLSRDVPAEKVFAELLERFLLLDQT